MFRYTKIVLSFMLAFFILPGAYGQSAKTSFKFDFGTGSHLNGRVRVTPEMLFNDTTGFGFDFGSKVSSVVRYKNKPYGTFITSDKPFYFSVNAPEGNYKVTVTLGDVKGRSTTTVRAESRRLMLEKIETAPGQVKQLSFIVNIRKPQISTGGSVSLKPRELGKLDWDNKLTLEFNDRHPCVDAIDIEKVDDQVTVYLAGNSTVVDQDDEPWASWGQMITRFFKPGVAIADHAESGLALSSFLNGHRLDKILSIIKPGDYLFIEFGHNDQKEKGPNDGAYKSYTEYFKTYISKIREKHAIPVIVTSTSRRFFDPKDSSKIINTLGDFPDAARKVAKDENVALIDLNQLSARFYEALGTEESKKAFVWYPANAFPGQAKPLMDNTHFNGYGAYELAKCVIEAIRLNHLGIEKYLVDTPRFDPSHPDPVDKWGLPPSPKNSTIKPDGN